MLAEFDVVDCQLGALAEHDHELMRGTIGQAHPARTLIPHRSGGVAKPCGCTSPCSDPENSLLLAAGNSERKAR